jgi:anti-sigma-K factor RskA
VVVTTGLGDLPETRTFQLWVLEPDTSPRSAGLMRPDAAGTTLEGIAEGIADAQNLAVTVEPAGGSPQPTTRPLLVIPVA